MIRTQKADTAVHDRIQYGEWIIAVVHFTGRRALGLNSGDRTQAIPNIWIVMMV